MVFRSVPHTSVTGVGIVMRRFTWPSHVRFDDTDVDMKEARRVWLEHRGMVQSGSVISDFLEFMEVYAREVEARRSYMDTSQESA